MSCKAHIKFHVDKNRTWTVTKHNTEHNHPMCNRSNRHLLPSHQKILENDIQYIKQLSDSGVLVADAVRLLEKQAGGPILRWLWIKRYVQQACRNYQK